MSSWPDWSSVSADEQERLAFHEAGHAVVSRWAGRRPGVVSIDKRKGGGACYLDAPKSRRDKLEWLRDELVHYIAGHAAECLARGVNPMRAEAAPDVIAYRILSHERATQAEKHHEGGELRYPDVRRWAVDTLAEKLHDETLAYEIIDELFGPDALRRAVEVLVDRWDEVESIAARLQEHGDIQL
jgi:cell division protease FtsH